MARRRDTRPLSVDEVFSGAVRPSIRDLARLVHETNPTGLKLPHREMQRRYAQKTRLQSLLLRWFPDDIEAVLDGSADGIALLRHRFGGFDACHVVVQELDDEARSIAQRMLDMGIAPAEAEGPARRKERVHSASPDGIERLMQEAQKALAEYDFDLARSHLSDALDRSHGGAKPAAALLELLVEQLGLFEEALALESTLSTEALENGSVRSLLARAAAHCGHRDRALELLQSCRNTRAAEVFALLARRAIEAGRLDLASSDYERCREDDPAFPELIELRTTIDRLLTQERRAARERAQQLAEERALQASRENELRADELAEVQDWDGALAALRRAIACTPTGTRNEAHALKIGAWEARRRETQDRAQRARVAQHLRDGDFDAGIVSYLECRAGVRGELRSQFPLVELELADTMAGCPNAKPKEVSAAIAALLRAEKLLEGDQDACIALLDQHSRLVLSTELGKGIRNSALDALRRTRRQEASASLDRARLAFAAEDLSSALELVGGEALQSMPDDLVEGARALRLQIEKAVEKKRRAARLARLSLDNFPFEALELIDGMLAEPDCEERASLLEQRQLLLARIQESYAVRVDTSARPLGLAPELTIRTPSGPWRYLLDDGRSSVHVMTRFDQVFIKHIDLLDRRVLASVTLRMPTSTHVAATDFRGDVLVIMFDDGTLLELSLKTWDIVGRTQLPLSASERPLSARALEIARGYGALRRCAFFGPDPRLVWIYGGDLDQLPTRIRVFDASRQTLLTEIKEPQGFWIGGLLHDLDEPWVLLSARTENGTDAESLKLYDTRGRRGPDIPGPMNHRTIWVHPDGRSIVYGPATEVKPGDAAGQGHKSSTGWRSWSAAKGVSEVPGLELPADLGAAFAVRDRQAEQTWLIMQQDGGARRLLGLRSKPDGELEVVQRVQVPARTALLQSPSGRVLAAVNGPQGLTGVPMADAPTVLGSMGDPIAFRPPVGFGVIVECHRAFESPDDAAGQFVAWMQARMHRIVEAEARITRVLDHGDATELLVAIDALDRFGLPAIVASLTTRAFERYPDHPRVRLAYGRVFATMGQWAQLADLLEPVDARDIDPANQRHFCHLLGAAYLQLGQADKAREVLKQGERFEGLCDLEWLLALAEPIAQPEDRAWSAETAALREFIATISRADEALDRNDPSTALATLDTWSVWELAEVQSFARMAEACMRLEQTTDLFREGLMVATFRQLHVAGSLLGRRDLPIRGRWDLARLHALDERASAWLAQRFGC